MVSRPRLIERLNAGLHHRLILISAPAGFGKTTLLSEWVHDLETRFFPENLVSGPPRPVAWISLDEGDNDPIRFWAYVVAALQTIPGLNEAGVGEAPLAALRSPQPPPITSLLTALINEIALIPDHFAIVLDDYHLITAHKIHDGLTFLLDHLPPQMHLVITTRSDPFLPLSRLRARGQMIDIRADDLRFSPQETTTFLNQVMGLALSGDQVVTLGTRTEGWIAGLQLAALSVQSQEDTAGFISAFTGDDRYIADYLVDEVLAQRPKGTKDFLLQTSILDRLTGPLCDAITGFSPLVGEGQGEGSGQAILERLEQANLFIVPLDNRRRWYRYHHLFADLLRQRLEESTTPQDIKSLHQRASQWYEENDFLIEAVEHRLAAGDHDDVMRLIEQHAEEMFQRSQLNTLIGWWAQLPQELVTSRPKLCMIYAWAWLATGHPGETEICLQAIERALGTKMGGLYAERDGAQVLPPAARATLVEVAVVRTQLAVGRGNIPETLKLSRLVLPYLEEDEGPYLYNSPKDSRTVVLFTVGLAHKFMRELSAADRALSDAATLGQEQGNVHIVALAFGYLASVQVIQGHLRQAVQTCQRGLQLVREMAGRRSPLSGLVQAVLGSLLYEKNDLEAALHNFQEGIAVAKPWNNWEALVPGYAGLARVRAAQGDWQGAFTALDELAALGQNNPEAVMPAVESFRATLWAAQGEVEAAHRWAQASGLGGDGELIYLRERETIILARVLIAQKNWDEATRLIDRLLDATETGERWGHVIELLILRALVRSAQGKQDEALEPLTRAFTLAEPGGYVRTFVDEGKPVAALLRQLPVAPYRDQILSAFSKSEEQGGRGAEERRDLPAPLFPRTPALVEPLSKRELEVLRLLQTELSGPEIARELTIGLSTVRTHTKNIYSKLNVNNRRAAVNRAEELDLI